MDSTCRSLGRSLPQPPALWGTRWAGRGGCNAGSSYFWDPRWRQWSLLPPEIETRTHMHEWVDRANAMTRCRKGWRDKIQNLLWTESGSPPWCNPGRNTFWWSAIGNAEMRLDLGKRREQPQTDTQVSFELCRRIHLALYFLAVDLALVAHTHRISSRGLK